MRWANDTRFAADRAYEDAAVDAMRELFRDLSERDSRAADTVNT
jgi:hypothetical protein